MALYMLTFDSFDLKQFHFHSPSEHTINGEHFPLEMHMVHQATGTHILSHAQYQK